MICVLPLHPPKRYVRCRISQNNSALTLPRLPPVFLPRIRSFSALFLSLWRGASIALRALTMPYDLPPTPTFEAWPADQVVLVASGDLRLSANQKCWEAQQDMERRIGEAFKELGRTVVRGHAYNEELKHGFIASQAEGIDVFSRIHPEAPLVVAEAVWQYSHHVLAGLRKHKGPILTVANWSGEWPGLVGLLNLNASLTKMQKPYSTLWSVDFKDEFFVNGLKEWLATGNVTHDQSHVHPLPASLPQEEEELGVALARALQHRPAILAVLDEGCMGMYNAIIDDEMLNACGIYKERLSQAALVAGMRKVTHEEASEALQWLKEKGMTVSFVTGEDEETELTEKQLLEQMKMYIAAVRMCHEFNGDVIGIQYQQGLKDMTVASDLAEGIMNNSDRPPVKHAVTGEVLYEGKPVPHFNEVDEGAGVDILVTNKVWSAMGMDPATTLHDIRWGEHFKGDGIDDFVWVLEISGSVPPSHFENGYASASSERQPPMYFRLGGGTIKGVSKVGDVVWSRVYVAEGGLHADVGLASSVHLPQEETERRWACTTPQWPMMHAIFHGVTRDQLMARHKANHVNVVYAPSKDMARRGLAAKAAMFREMGITVHVCGDVQL